MRAELHSYRRGVREDTEAGEMQPPGQRGRGLIYSQYEDSQDDDSHPHYHQYEDEVCLKCDNAGLLTADTRQSLSPRTSPRRCTSEDAPGPVSPRHTNVHSTRDVHSTSGDVYSTRDVHSTEGCDYVPSPAPSGTPGPPAPPLPPATSPDPRVLPRVPQCVCPGLH